jgi:hypothetical protein
MEMRCRYWTRNHIILLHVRPCSDADSSLDTHIRIMSQLHHSRGHWKRSLRFMMSDYERHIPCVHLLGGIQHLVEQRSVNIGRYTKGLLEQKPVRRESHKAEHKDEASQKVKS